MKEKINSFAKGEFIFIQPEIRLSVESININIETGSTFQGSFILANQKGTAVKAVLYSSSHYLILENNQVIGIENQINYTINAEHLDVEDVINGSINIISDCGEMRLPFSIHVEAPTCETSIGKIKDLFQFTNLAKTDWAEAVKVFKSEKFMQVLGYYNKRYFILYKHLLKSRKSGKALEEFLIAVHKKLRITYTVDKTEFSYNITGESFLDKFVLSKDVWGYDELSISTDAPFIELERNKIWTDDFVSNSYEVSFVVNPEKVKYGNNYATINVESLHQQIAIHITCTKTNSDSLNILERRKLQQYELKLTDNYISFKLGKINTGKYLAEAESLISILMTGEDNLKYELYRIYAYIQAGKESVIRQTFNSIYEDRSIWNYRSAEIISAVKYINVLLQKDTKLTLLTLEEIRTLYERNSDSWLPALMIVWLDKRISLSPAMKFDIYRKQFEKGCKSPVLYYEAAELINNEPSVLKDIDDFELQVLNFGAKKLFFTKEATAHISYIASRSKQFNKLMYRMLEHLYKKYKLKETLSAVCTILIKGRLFASEYHRWYELGVNEQLRITELYEYYIYSADDNNDRPIPQQIFTYFSFDSQLDENKQAYLYSNLIIYKDRYQAIYSGCEKAIINFAIEQLKQGNISHNLAVIYEEVFHRNLLNDELVAHFSEIAFRYEIVCKNRNITEVCVAHKELGTEAIVPLINGRAQIDIFTENAEILLIDRDNNRISATVDYTLNKLLRMEEILKPLYKGCTDNKKLAFYLLEDAQYRKLDSELVEMYKQVIRYDELEDEFRKECELKLIYYFYDNLDGELLESHLLKLNFRHIGHADRIRMIEFMIIRELYNSALVAMQEYGYEGVSVKRLLKLVSRMLQVITEDKQRELILDISYYVFSKGKYNEIILKHLVEYYNGATSEMYEIWKAARNFDLETTSIEERLIGQMLFAESYVSDAKILFRNYYNRGANRKLIKACLSYYAYRYLLNDRIIETELFDIMRRELNYEENDLCLLALLKFYSGIEKLNSQEVNFINHHIRILQNKNMIPPFIKDFKCREVIIPQNMLDKYYVEYHADASDKIKIHYMFETNGDNENFTVESMTNIAYGIFVKEFTVFYNEYLQYYITSDTADDGAMLESGEIRLEPTLIGSEETKYQQLNLIITAREMNDEKTVIRMLESYIKNEYRVDKLFHPI